MYHSSVKGYGGGLLSNRALRDFPRNFPENKGFLPEVYETLYSDIPLEMERVKKFEKTISLSSLTVSEFEPVKFTLNRLLEYSKR